MNQNRKPWLYLLFGVAAGATLGVLFAPRAGKETRENLNEWLRIRREKGQKLITELKDRFPAKNRQHVNAGRDAKEPVSV
ncbi:MAG: YtxH domain-containing protein [Elusimicrobia bacterium]|nr:YtxH domain-containing protein [Elusimicrobiota bacterium]